MVPISTINNNKLASLTLFSTITPAAISSASGMVNINPALTIPVAATGQDLNFATSLDNCVCLKRKARRNCLSSSSFLHPFPE